MKLPCKHNDFSKQFSLRFQSGLSSLRVSCICALSSYSPLGYFSFGAIKLTKNADSDKYSYYRDSVGFDTRRIFS